MTSPERFSVAEALRQLKAGDIQAAQVVLERLLAGNAQTPVSPGTRVVVSEERETHHGGIFYTAVGFSRGWCRVSRHKSARFLGRRDGFERYELTVPADCPVATFRVANMKPDNQTVEIEDGPTLDSFVEADRWLKNHLSQRRR